jgi:hypothetical protein
LAMRCCMGELYLTEVEAGSSSGMLSTIAMVLRWMENGGRIGI